MATCPAPADPDPAAGKPRHFADVPYPTSLSIQVTVIPKQRHIPERSCIACGQKRPKGDLIRLVRTPDDEVRPDTTGRANGRGVYLCRQATCWEKGLVRRSLERGLRNPVSNTDLDALKRYFIETVAPGVYHTGSGTAPAAVREAEG
ncbi:MAG: YlxR family protein [Chloroflexi bacterium]|nr:YlxR family protein [Chloroflexota bacterium]